MVFKDISYLERQIEKLFHTNRTIIWSCDFKQVNFHKQRVITTESMVLYGPLSNLKKASWY